MKAEEMAKVTRNKLGYRASVSVASLGRLSLEAAARAAMGQCWFKGELASRANGK